MMRVEIVAATKHATPYSDQRTASLNISGVVFIITPNHVPKTQIPGYKFCEDKVWIDAIAAAMGIGFSVQLHNFTLGIKLPIEASGYKR